MTSRAVLAMAPGQHPTSSVPSSGRQAAVVHTVILLGNLIVLGGAVFVGISGGGVFYVAVAPVVTITLASIARQVVLMRRD